MTAPALTHRERRRHWCTAAAMTTWSSLAHSVIMRCLRSSCMFCTPCLAVFPTHKSTGFKFGEVGGHKYRQNEFWRFSPSFFNDVTITSSFRSVVQVLMGHFYKFSVSRTVRMTWWLVFRVSFHSVLRPLGSSAQCTSPLQPNVTNLREPLCGSCELQKSRWFHLMQFWRLI